LKPRPKTLLLVLWILSILSIAAIATMATSPIHRLLLRRDPPPPQRLTIEEIQCLSSLVTARVQVADVMLVDHHGLTGGIQVAAVIRGEYLIETDLSKARFEQVDAARRRAVLFLPPPQASNPRVDLDRSRLFGLSSYGLWQITPGDASYLAIVNRAYAQAQATVATAAGNEAARAQARRQAEAVLSSFVHALGWEVAVRWEVSPTSPPATASREAP